jgi:hypothetical protein
MEALECELGEYRLEKTPYRLFEYSLSFGKPTDWGWTHVIYLDQNTGRFVVPDFRGEAMLILGNVLPELNKDVVIKEIKRQHHSDDKPLKRNPIVKVII